jgi:hypothetical protein
MALGAQAASIRKAIGKGMDLRMGEKGTGKMEE